MRGGGVANQCWTFVPRSLAGPPLSERQRVRFGFSCTRPRRPPRRPRRLDTVGLPSPLRESHRRGAARARNRRPVGTNAGTDDGRGRLGRARTLDALVVVPWMEARGDVGPSELARVGSPPSSIPSRHRCRPTASLHRARTRACREPIARQIRGMPLTEPRRSVL
jgi:hypothetical protein